MAAKNDITGDSISSKVLSMQGRYNWDVIFGVRRTAYEWCKHKHPGVEILNPSGWTYVDGVTLQTRITEEDFDQRFSISTIG